MKKLIAIVTIGATTAFLQVQAQETPASTGSSETTTTQENPSATTAGRVEIEKSEIPQKVMDSFDESEYSDMDIVNAYEVNSSEAQSTVPYSSGDESDTENNTQTTSPTNSTSDQLEQAANQTEQSVDEAATGIEQDAENVAEQTEEQTTNASQQVQAEAGDFAQNTEQAASDVGRETEEDINNEAIRAESLIENDSQAIGDTAINEVNGGDAMKEDTNSTYERPSQSSDDASASGSSGQMTDTDQSSTPSMTETETTEEMENSGKVMSAEAPATAEDPATTVASSEEEQREVGKELYENNQYDNYTDANEDAYEKIAKEQSKDSPSKQYELTVQGEDESVTLTYDENGELVKTDKGSM